MTDYEFEQAVMSLFERVRAQQNISIKSMASVLGISVSTYNALVRGEIGSINSYYIFKACMRFPELTIMLSELTGQTDAVTLVKYNSLDREDKRFIRDAIDRCRR